MTERLTSKNGVQLLSEGRTTRKRKQMSETILTAENLKFRYDSEQPGYALNGVSMQVRRGEFVAVLGANGCGKSTLAKHFNAILLPEEGKVYVEGMDTADDDKLYDIRQTVGMVFQSFNLFPHKTVLQNLTMAPMKLRHISKHEAEERALQLLKKVGLSEKVNVYPSMLSGGQQQRVAIARAVVANPKLILADEPTGNLDSKNGQEVMNLLSELNKEGTTIVMVTHSQHDAGFASRTINLFDGQVVTETLI